VIHDLEHWGVSRNWLGPDPYEGMNSPFLAPLARTPLARRAVIQFVKRSPVDLRTALRIPRIHNPATLAHLLSAYCRLPIEDDYRHERLRWATELLLGLRRPEFAHACWSYHFDVETRFMYYSSSTPNTIASALGGLALLDVAERTGDEECLDVAQDVGRFFLESIGLNRVGDEAFFGYYPGDRTPIHNASLYAASLLAELTARGGSPELADAAATATVYSLDRQRPDGSWPYAENETGAWVDGYHTGFVMDCLGRLERSFAALGKKELSRRITAARSAGLSYYKANLFEASGAARFYSTSLYPIDATCAAHGIMSFSLAARTDPIWLEQAWLIFEWAVENMRRRDGAFMFQRRRYWVNRAPHVRWVEAPMLHALGCLHQALSAEQSP
jgi:polysaccharide biosynthesis protein VpsJ